MRTVVLVNRNAETRRPAARGTTRVHDWKLFVIFVQCLENMRLVRRVMNHRMRALSTGAIGERVHAGWLCRLDYR
jgi:hypothetical protein